MNISEIVNKIDPRKLFIIDSAGALVTALMLGFFIPSFESVYGVVDSYLYPLSGIAFIYSVYSFICYLKIRSNWRLFLRIIAIANFMYCAITIGIVFYLHSVVNNLGILYFSGEAVVIIVLALFELKVAAKKG